MTSILIAEYTRRSNEIGRPSYGQILSQGLSSDFKIYSSGSFLKILSLAGEVDTIFATTPVGSGYAAYLAAKLRKKSFLLRVEDDYAWRSAIESGKTYLLASDFQKFPKKGHASGTFKRQARICAQADVIIVPSKFMSEIVSGWGVMA